jgi:hypothetical protein
MEKTTSGRINNILNDINCIIDTYCELSKNIQVGEDSSGTFVDYEKRMKNNIDTIKNKVLEINGELVSNINEHLLLQQQKKFYKGNGIILRTNRKVSVTILTTCGNITIKRYALAPKSKKDRDVLKEKFGITAVIPMDEWIGINKYHHKISPLALLDIAYYAVTALSFHSAASLIERITGVNISHETVRAVASDVGAFVFNNEMKIADLIIKNYKTCSLKKFNYNINYTLYIETDGAMLHLRYDKMQSNDIQNNENITKIGDKNKEDTNGWYENKLGLVFSSDNLELKNTKSNNKSTIKVDNMDNEKDIILELAQDTNIVSEVHYKVLKREYVSFIGSVEIFQKLLFATAIKNGYGQYKNTVLLSDGATWIRNMKLLYFPDATQILDFYHLCEHIYDFSKRYYNEDSSKFTPWSKYAIHEFKTGKKSKMISEIKTMQSKIKDNKFNFYNYLQNNINNIDYANYLDSGYFIGSGHIESGNKSVMQERLKRPGMIWSKGIAQYLLSLRSKIKSDLWNKDVEIPFLSHCYKK